MRKLKLLSLLSNAPTIMLAAHTWELNFGAQIAMNLFVKILISVINVGGLVNV